MTYRISRRANADLEAIWDYIAKDAAAADHRSPKGVKHLPWYYDPKKLTYSRKLVGSRQFLNMYLLKIAFKGSTTTVHQARRTISVSVIALLVFVCALPVFAGVDDVNKDLRKVVSDLGKTDISKSSGRLEGPRDMSLFNVEPTVVQEDVIPLHLFVSKGFDAAAQLIQVGNTKKAMTLLRKIDASQSYAAAESHYLKAICLQSLRKFPESCAEYLLVETYSRDSSLSVKAKLGYEQAQANQHSINRNLLYFPRTWYPGSNVRMTNDGFADQVPQFK